MRIILGANGLEVMSACSPIGIISNMTPIPFLQDLIDMAQEDGEEAPFVLTIQERVVGGSIYILSYIGIAFYNWKRKMI